MASCASRRAGCHSSRASRFQGSQRFSSAAQSRRPRPLRRPLARRHQAHRTGEYVLERPGDPEQGHFGLAVQDYTHSTRQPTLRRRGHAKADQGFARWKPGPYSDTELAAIATNCTAKGDAARKVEREMSKRMSAIAMSHRVGETFDAIVTGVTPKGTFVRRNAAAHRRTAGARSPRLARRRQNRAKLTRTDVQRGFIDFVKA